MFKYMYILALLCLELALANITEDPSSNNEGFDSEVTCFNVTTTTTEPPPHDERYHLFSIDFERVHSPMIIVMWLFLACIGKIAFHMAPKLSHMLPESVIIIVLGLIIGGLLYYANPNRETQVSPLTADNFFLYLLPPIILDAGYFMPNRLFFDHLGTILTFAVVGTIWNVLTIGISLYALATTGIFGDPDEFNSLHILLFSSLISAVDPVAVLAVFEEIHVEEVLFILVFGESQLNDGVTVVLYHIFEGFSGLEEVIMIDIVNGFLSFIFIAFGGTLIGIIWGFFTAFVTRFTHEVTVIEPMFIFLMSYLSYLNAELFHFSGILAITFCGITMKNYTEQNISQNSSITTKYAMKMLASSSETVIFLFLGVATVHGTEHSFNGWFIFFTILFCSFYRILGVLILSAVCNRFRVTKIDFVQKFVMCYGGLRGAVAFALAITIDKSLIALAPTFVTTTIAVVFFTVFIQGITIKPLVEKLGVKKSSKRVLKMNERLHERTMDYIMAGVEDIIGKRGKYYMRGWFKRINNKYLQPRLVRDNSAREPKLFETLSNLKMEEAMKYMRESHITDLESLAQILNSNMYKRNSIREWNLDVGEIEYKPNDRDDIETQLHHLLSEPNAANSQRRQSTYKRHAVKDSDLLTQSDFEMRMALQARHVAMSGIRNRKNRKLGKQASSSSLKNGMAINVNGSAIKLKDDHLQERTYSNMGFTDDEGLFMKNGTAEKPKIEINIVNSRRYSSRGPTAAETMLPWKRYDTCEPPTRNSEVRRTSVIPHDFVSDSPQALAEVVLPWKRNEDDWSYEPRKDISPWGHRRNEFLHYSPTYSLLEENNEQDETLSVQDLFAERSNSRDRSGCVSSSSDLPTLRNSAKDNIYRRRSSLKDDPSMRRSSLSDFHEHVSSRNRLTPSRHGDGPHRHYSHDSRLNSRKSTDSLLHTVIVEEGSSKNNGGTPRHVNMNPNGDNTRF